MRIKLKKCSVFLLFIAMFLTFMTVKKDVKAAPRATKITLNSTKKTIVEDSKITLKVKTIKPKKASKKVTWKTSNKSIATVSSKGVVTAKKPGKVTITAISKSNKKVKAVCKVTVTTRYYTVTFKDYNNKVLKVQKVAKGKSATAPKAPLREGYKFDGWNRSYNNVKSNLTVIASYSAIYHLVAFFDYDGKSLGMQTIRYGSAAKAPTPPVHEGYTFTGWSKDFSNVKSELVVYAQYSKNPPVVYYSVEFYDYDGSLIDTVTVKKGEDALAPAVPPREGYTFEGWDKILTNITSDLKVTARYSDDNAEYTVTFLDYDNSSLGTVGVKKGETASAPAVPPRDGYTFTGWDRELTNVTSDFQTIAQYSKNDVYYSVSFFDYDGRLMQLQEVISGGSAKAPQVPAREGYTFTGWDKEFVNITADLDVTAQYSKNDVYYTVEFQDDVGNLISSVQVKEGEIAVAPNAPEKEGYSFVGWDKSIENVTSDLVVSACYASNKPTFFVENVKSSPGSTNVAVAVSVKNNPGILGMTLSVKYDEDVMTLVGADNGTAVKNAMTLTKPGVYAPGCNFVWDGVELLDDDIKDGDILILKFNISNTALSGSYPIKIFYQEGNIIDKDLAPISLDVENGEIEI